MNFILKSLFSYFIMVSSILTSHAQNNQEIDNLVAFAKAYGYVKYFHPSIEGDQVDWGWFSVYGSGQVIECQNNEELLQIMHQIFKPIAPTVTFTLGEPSDQSIQLKPAIEQGYLPVYWQHFGVSRDMNKGNPLYRSVKVNSLLMTERNQNPTGENPKSTDNRKVAEGKLIPAPSLFEGSPIENNIWTRPLGKDLWIGMPLVLYSKEGQTYPKSNTDIEEFMAAGEKATATDASALSFRFGNLINA